MNPPKPPSNDGQHAVRILIDGDACPVKEEIYRIADRHGVPVVVVAAGYLRIPHHPLISRVAAGNAPDAADDYIASHVDHASIAVTSDVPLASRCVKAGAAVLGPTGKPFTEDSIGMALAVRNLMTDLRASGEITGGPRGFSSRDRSAFLSALDQAVRRLKRNPQR